MTERERERENDTSETQPERGPERVEKDRVR